MIIKENDQLRSWKKIILKEDWEKKHYNQFWYICYSSTPLANGEFPELITQDNKLAAKWLKNEYAQCKARSIIQVKKWHLLKTVTQQLADIFAYCDLPIVMRIARSTGLNGPRPGKPLFCVADHDCSSKTELYGWIYFVKPNGEVIGLTAEDIDIEAAEKKMEARLKHMKQVKDD
jgi:hypothetical protein